MRLNYVALTQNRSYRENDSISSAKPTEPFDDNVSSSLWQTYVLSGVGSGLGYGNNRLAGSNVITAGIANSIDGVVILFELVSRGF